MTFYVKDAWNTKMILIAKTASLIALVLFEVFVPWDCLVFI